MTVGLVIVSHSAQLAEGAAELARQMTQDKVPIATAGGAVNNILGTSVDKIHAAIQAVNGADGVLVLVDLGSAILSTEMALEMLDSEQSRRVSLSFAPLVEGAIAAAIEASLGHSLAEVKQAAGRTANREQLQLLKPISTSQEETSDAAATSSPAAPLAQPGVLETHLTLTNPTGLHARPASLFVQTAGRFAARIEVVGRGRQTEATSIIGVLSLGLRKGDTLILRAVGTEAETALKALEELVRADFYETPPDSATLAATPASEAPTVQPVLQAIHQAWQGMPTSPGIAIGPALLYTSSSLTLDAVQRHSISSAQVVSEQERLRGALGAAAQELRALVTRLEKSIGQAEAAIFDAQALMLQDPALLGAGLYTIEEQHIDAASALATVGEQQAVMLEALDNPLLAARSADMRDAVGRALRHLRVSIGAKQDLSTLKSPVILVAQDLTPSDTASLQPETVLGICTTLGGPTAHAAILARALGIPAIAGLNEAALSMIHAGDELGLDADNGLLYHRPTPDVQTQLTQRLTVQHQQRAALQIAAQKEQAVLSINGRRISLLANIGSEAEAEAARQWGAGGVGLLRTEFLFAHSPTLPGEEEQRQRYVRVFQAFRGDASRQAGPITVRTLDAGADKPMPALDAILSSTAEANPALGLRGIRISLAHPALLEQQLSALLLAAVETGIHLHIMFPMIATVEELRTARAIFDQVYEGLKRRQIAVPEYVPIGIMIEVPSAVTMAAELAELADFFSIGANDLLQYSLASDRTNTTVADLYKSMQPALLRSIAQVAEAGRRAGKAVAVCGEIAGDARLAPLLVGLGVDELSMTPTAIPAVRAALTAYTGQELSELAQKVLQMKTVGEVEEALTEKSK